MPKPLAALPRKSLQALGYGMYFWLMFIFGVSTNSRWHSRRYFWCLVVLVVADLSRGTGRFNFLQGARSQQQQELAHL